MSAFPFTAIVGQDEMRQALLISAVDPNVGGVLVFGDRGTGKSTAVRALAGLLPKIAVRENCHYNTSPDGSRCAGCSCVGGGKQAKQVQIPVVDLPLGVTEDRVVGALDIEKALAHGEKAFEPGLLARANRGFLYVDEVNLLEDHIIDLLLDVAATGENVVEREGLSVRHPARFVLVGSGNPEEGELRPQLLDRFGLSVSIATPTDIEQRVEIVRRRDDFERDPVAFRRRWSSRESKVRRQILAARDALHDVDVPDAAIRRAAELCVAAGTDGLRGELTLVRAARALAALRDLTEVGEAELKAVAPAALGHRLRRDPLDDAAAGVRVSRALDSVFTA
ncbi:MAG: magnesium chelatase ATPase subunit I [Pseudomonadota bacterium]